MWFCRCVCRHVSITVPARSDSHLLNRFMSVVTYTIGAFRRRGRPASTGVTLHTSPLFRSPRTTCRVCGVCRSAPPDLGGCPLSAGHDNLLQGYNVTLFAEGQFSHSWLDASPPPSYRSGDQELRCHNIARVRCKPRGRVISVPPARLEASWMTVIYSASCTHQPYREHELAVRPAHACRGTQPRHRFSFRVTPTETRWP